MSNSVELIALSVFAALFPVGLHFGGLRGASLRPPLSTQSGMLERLTFRYLPLLFALNGFLVGAAVFLAKKDFNIPAIIVGLAAIPSIVAQIAALMIAKSRDVAGLDGQSSNVR